MPTRSLPRFPTSSKPGSGRSRVPLPRNPATACRVCALTTASSTSSADPTSGFLEQPARLSSGDLAHQPEEYLTNRGPSTNNEDGKIDSGQNVAEVAEKDE